MRRTDRQIEESEAFSILENGEYGILSTLSTDNVPYGIPLNYSVIDRKVYIHCALEGRKLDNLTANPQVSFCVVMNTKLLPGDFGSMYESCILQGSALEVSGDEKQNALEAFLLKYSEDFLTEGMRYIEKLKGKTRVFCISIDSITGKARR